MRRRFDLTPLSHPIWWAALALLLVNDDLLKGRGVVPGWLTGKLSDFAFLIVAPVLFAVLIPRRVPGRRTFAVAAVVALYVAADLSRAVSDAVVALAGRLGLSWRLWPDPTDLLALAVLPVTIWLLRRRPAPADGGAAARRARVRRERAGVVLGAIACVATSAPAQYQQHPFLHNRTGGDVAVQITWVLRKVDCAVTPESLAATLGPSDLDDNRMMTLRSGDVAALDGPPPQGTSAVGLCATRGDYSYGSADCVAAIVETDGAQPVLMLTPQQWFLSADSALICPGPPPESQCAPHLDPKRRIGPDTLGISNVAGTLTFEVSRVGRTEQGPVDSSIQIAPVDPVEIAARPPTPGACRETRDAFRALLQSSNACASDIDCTTLPAPAIPGESASCAIYVNKTASAGAFAGVGAQWNGMCVNASDGCVAASAPVCKAGACADPCAGLALPMCAVSCGLGVNYADKTKKTACNADFSCLQTDGMLCTCEGGYLSCQTQPLADPRCPIACLPAKPNQHRSTPAIVPDAGMLDPDGLARQDAGAGDAAASDAGGSGDAAGQ